VAATKYICFRPAFSLASRHCAALRVLSLATPQEGNRIVIGSSQKKISACLERLSAAPSHVHVSILAPVIAQQYPKTVPPPMAPHRPLGTSSARLGRRRYSVNGSEMQNCKMLLAQDRPARRNPRLHHWIPRMLLHRSRQTNIECDGAKTGGNGRVKSLVASIAQDSGRNSSA